MYLVSKTNMIAGGTPWIMILNIGRQYRIGF